MALYGLLDFDPKDIRSVEEWALWHFSDHQEIREAIQTALGKNLTEWDIFPLELKHWDQFALKHQAAHNEMNSASGLSGDDLTQVDFKDLHARQEWHYKHFREHNAQRVKYGI